MVKWSEERTKPRRWRPVMILTAGFLAVTIAALGPTLSPAGTPAPASANLDGPGLYARLKKEMLSHRAYTTVYYHRTERGKKHEIYSQMTCSGRYLRQPAVYCEKRLTFQASFPDQAGVGFQECYTGKDDMTRLLMPGAMRALGVIPMYPEDPKADYLNGENTKIAAVWTWFNEWDRMAPGGKITAASADRKGKPHYVLTIQRGTNPDPLYHHDLVKIWVDPANWWLARVETYAAGDPKPVVVFDFQEVKLDVPLTEKDMTFEGPVPGWNLVTPPTGPKLNTLAQEEPKLQDAPDLNPPNFVALLDQALAKVNDYQCDLTLELRYRRLRQYKQDVYRFIKPRSFSSQTSKLEANYIQLNGGEGFRLVSDPSRDPLLHVIPAGVYKVMGEQTFPLDDPRIFTAMGDNITDMSFFAIQAELKRRLADAANKRTATATYRAGSGKWIELVEKDLGISQRPSIMRVLLDPKTGLPLRLEYRGYGDKSAYLAVAFLNVKLNPGLKPPDLWK